MVFETAGKSSAEDAEVQTEQSSADDMILNILEYMPERS
jgi:hypothetical protein